MTECNTEDILCQIEILRHLRGLKQELGNEQLRAKFPELGELDKRISEAIPLQKEEVRSTLARCASDMEDLMPEESGLFDEEED